MNDFLQKLSRYELGKMSPEEASAFEAELQRNEKELPEGEFGELAGALKAYRRPLPPADLLQAYEASLAERFPGESGTGAAPTSRGRIIQWILSPPPAVRILEIAAVLIIGFFIGRTWFFDSNSGHNPLAVAEVNAFGSTISIHDVSSREWQGLQGFLLESEMLLLDVSNTSPQSIDGESLEFKSQMSKRLLKQIPVTQQISVRMNDLSLVRYLSKLEMILYEISNLQIEEAGDTLPLLKSMIADNDLLIEARELQKALKQSNSTVDVL